MDKGTSRTGKKQQAICDVAANQTRLLFFPVQLMAFDCIILLVVL